MNGYPDTYGQSAPGAQADIFTYPQNLQHALQLIVDATGGETADRQFYTWLISQAPYESDREIIAGIRDDEIGHFSLFRRLYHDLTGTDVPSVPEEQFTPPANYCQGLARALIGEQNAVRKYRQILYAMQNRTQFNIMTEIISDELRHGILYNYLYTKNGCRG